MSVITIIGNGKMAEAICKGLGNSFEVEVLGRNLHKLESFKQNLEVVKIDLISNNKNITNKIIVLCVKPYALADAIKDFEGEADIVISILAGTSLEKIKNLIKAKSYIRAMPNVGASFQKSMTTLTGDATARKFATDLFERIGSTLWVGTQKELDIATAIAGSGPAYLALVADALIDGGVALGLTREDAKKLTVGLFDGFANNLTESEPSQIKASVMSPGGTTAAAICHLEEKSTRSAFIGCVKSAYQKAVELSK